MERALRRAGKEGKYGSIIHFTHGFHPMARFHESSLVESIRAPGCNTVGLGAPWWEEGGGENHPDAVIAMHSLWIGEEAIVSRGALVLPELARLESALETSLG